MKYLSCRYICPPICGTGHNKTLAATHDTDDIEKSTGSQVTEGDSKKSCDSGNS